MLIILYLLLMLRVGRCRENLTFATETVKVGDDVNLTCPRPETLDDYESTLHWIRLVSGNWPEFLGGTYGFKYDDDFKKTPHITAKQEPGTFILHIRKAKLNDTGVYYCIKVDSLHMTFLNGIFLRIKGPEPDITAVIQVSPSDPVRPGDSVTLQCSVLSDSDNKTCPEDHSVYWFRAKPDESHRSLIYVHQNNTDECERIPETHSQKCVYSFSKDISSSDAGTYYCAVATCGEILFGNGTKLNIKAMWDLEKANIVVFLLCAALATSLIVIAFLIYTIKKKHYDDSASGFQQNQQRDESPLVYSAPTIMSMRAGKAKKNARTTETEVVYSGASASAINE